MSTPGWLEPEARCWLPITSPATDQKNIHELPKPVPGTLPDSWTPPGRDTQFRGVDLLRPPVPRAIKLLFRQQESLAPEPKNPSPLIETGKAGEEGSSRQAGSKSLAFRAMCLKQGRETEEQNPRSQPQWRTTLKLHLHPQPCESPELPRFHPSRVSEENGHAENTNARWLRFPAFTAVRLPPAWVWFTPMH